MKVLIIEDENLAAKRLKSLILAYESTIEILEWIDSVEDAVLWFKNNPHPDLLFLDIQLADGLSFRIFDQVKVNAPIIFTTAYDEYALRAFKLNSIDYLLKPIDLEELSAAFAQYKERHKTKTALPDFSAFQQAMQMIAKKYKTRFVVKRGHQLESIHVDDIAYFFSEHKMTWLKTKSNKKYAVDFSLDQLTEALNPKLFFRINRKYITSIDAIKNVVVYSNSRLKIVLTQEESNDKILISRDKVSIFKEWFGGDM